MAEKTEKEKLVAIERKNAIKNDEQLQNISEDIKAYAETEAVAKLPGGKKLIASLESDVLMATIALTVKYKTAPHLELMALCASLESKMDLLRRMTQAGKNKDDATKDFNNRLSEILGE